jgi:hypothetical protein
VIVNCISRQQLTTIKKCLLSTCALYVCLKEEQRNCCHPNPKKLTSLHSFAAENCLVNTHVPLLPMIFHRYLIDDSIGIRLIVIFIYFLSFPAPKRYVLLCRLSSISAFFWWDGDLT